MDKSNSTAIPPSFTKPENFDNAKDFVKELKVCTLDPARYLQRCIAISTTGTRTYATASNSKDLRCLANTGTLRDICISKRSFITEKPDYGMITNIITSRAPGNYYNTQVRPCYQTLAPKVYNFGQLTNATGPGADNKSMTLENPKKLLLQMLKSAVMSAKKKHAAHLNSKNRKKKKKHLKSTRSCSYKTEHFKDRKSHYKARASASTLKGAAKVLQANAKNQNNPSKNSNMINKMLEETEEMLRITFLSNINCFSGASATPITESEFLEKPDMSQVISNFISKMLDCAKNINTDNSRQSANTFISTTVTRKHKGTVKKSLKNSQSHVSAICKRKNSSTVSVKKQEVNRDQGKFKLRQKKDKMPIGFGRPGKDDTEDAELAHCTIQPDPPSAISAPYRERHPSSKTVAKSPLPQESITSMKSDIEEENTNFTSSCLQRLRDTIMDNDDQTKLLPLEYNSQITYVCPSTEFNLKGKEEECATGSGDKLEEELLAESQKALIAFDSPVKNPMVEMKCKTNQGIEKKTGVKGNVSSAFGRMTSKGLVETRTMQQRKVSDIRSKYSDSEVQARKSQVFRSNNKQVFKKQSERKLYTNPTRKNDVKPCASSSFNSGGLRYTAAGSRYQRQQKRLPIYEKDIRLHAVTNAERRFFNRNEHLLFLARPNTRYAEDTKQRYSQVLDQYHVRNLNTIIFCNQAEETRLKRKKKDLLIEEFIQEAVKNGVSSRIIQEAPKAPNVSEASSSLGSTSAHSIGTESDTVSNLMEVESLEDIPVEEMERKSKLSIIQEEPEDIEDVDKFYMTIAKTLDNYLNISSLLFDGTKVTSSETHAQHVDKVGAPEVELDYRVSDRFQTEVPDIVVSEIEKVAEDNILALHNPEIVSEQCDRPVENIHCFSVNLDVAMPLQLCKSMESVASNIGTFITVFEGMKVTLKDIQKNCQLRSIYGRNYITLDEIQKDCAQALLRAKEYNSCTEKYLGANNNIQVLLCEHYFANSALSSETKNCHDNFLYVLYRDSEQHMFEIINGPEKNDAWNKLMTVNLLNYSPVFIKKLDYFTVLELNPSKLLQEFIIEPNVLHFVKTPTKVTNNPYGDSVDYELSDASMNIPDRNSISDNTSLPLQNALETIEDENENDAKSEIFENDILIDTANRIFGVEEGQTELFIVGHSIDLKELIDYIPFPEDDAEIELYNTEIDQICDDISYLSALQSSDCETEGQSDVFTDCESTPSKESIDCLPRPCPLDNGGTLLNGYGMNQKYKNINRVSTIQGSESGGEEGHTEDFTDCESIPSKELVVWRPFIPVVKFPVDDTGMGLYATEMNKKYGKISSFSNLHNIESAHRIEQSTPYLKEDILNKNEENNNNIKQNNSAASKCISQTDDQMDLGDNVQEKVAVAEVSSGEYILPQITNLQHENSESCSDESETCIPDIDENAVPADVKNNLEIGMNEVRQMSLSDNVSSLRMVINHRKSSKAKGALFSDCYNAYHTLWASSSEGANHDLNAKFLSSKAENDIRNALACHSSPSLLKETLSLQERIHELRNGEELFCSKQPIDPTPKLGGISKLTQTDISVEPHVILTERQKLKTGKVPSDGSSSRRKSKLLKVVTFFFLLLLAISAAGLVSSIPINKPAVLKLIKEKIIPKLVHYIRKFKRSSH